MMDAAWRTCYRCGQVSDSEFVLCVKDGGNLVFCHDRYSCADRVMDERNRLRRRVRELEAGSA